jgi:hypothetical protein
MTKLLQRSFGGGELAPELYGRVDLPKYETGLAVCRNFTVLPHGPVANRPGFEFIREVKDSGKPVRLIPFVFSVLQTYVLELGEHYIRIHTNGGTLLDPITGQPLEIATPYTVEDLPGLKYVQSADVMTLVHPRHPPREFKRLGANSWTLEVINFGTVVAAPASAAAVAGRPPGSTLVKVSGLAVTGGTTTNPDPEGGSAPTRRYRVAAFSATAVGEASNALSVALFDVGSPITLSWNSVSGATGYAIFHEDSSGVYGLRRVQTGTSVQEAQIGTVNAKAVRAAPENAPDIRVFRYRITALDERYNESLPSPIATCSGRTPSENEPNIVTWAAVPGAARYQVYKEFNGLFGYAGTTESTEWRDENMVPDLGMTLPQLTEPFTGAGDYPGTVSYFEQRRCFGATTNRPQTIWMTRAGTESDFSTSLPPRADDAITVTLAARQVNQVRHIVPLSDLIVLTSSGEWRVMPANDDVLTPANVTMRVQGAVGAADLQPILANNVLLYVQFQSARVWELAYSWEANTYRSNDVSILATHLFDGYTLLDWAYAATPHSISWAVRSDGALLGLTYLREQQVYAWHRHDTAGAFESVATIREGAEDALYAVVRRTVGGVERRYIERLHTRRFAQVEDAFFVDCGLTYVGEQPVTTISGLDHLEGEQVAILADGSVQPPQTVSGGAIELQHPARKVHVGLPITAQIQTLPWAWPVEAYGQGTRKNVAAVILRVDRSRGIWAGPTLTQLTEVKQRTTENYGEPTRPTSDEVRLTVAPAWSNGGQLWVQQTDPLPLTITAMVPEIQTGG